MYKTPEAIEQGLARSMSTETALKLYENILAKRWNTSDIAEGFAKEILKAKNDKNIEMISQLIKDEQYNVIDQITDTRRKSYLKNKKYISIDDGMKELKPIYEMLEKESPEVKNFWFKLLGRSDVKEWSKIQQLLSNPDIVEEIKQLKNADEISLVTQSLVKQIKTMNTVDATSIETCKNIFKAKWVSAGGVEAVQDATQNMVSYLGKNRYINKWVPEWFEAWGKFEKYQQYKTAYEEALKETNVAEREAKLEVIDGEFAKQLLKDGKSLSDIMWWEYAKLGKSVAEDMEYLQQTLKSKSMINIVQRSRLKSQIASLETFEKKIPSLVWEDLSKVIKLEALNIRPRHMIEILNVAEDVNSNVAKTFARSNAWIEELITALRADRQLNKNIIAEDTIVLFEDLKVRNIARAGESIVEVFQIFAKIVRGVKV